MKKLLAAVCSALVLAACETPTEAIYTVALSEIARAQAVAGDTAGARKTASLAVETARARTQGADDLAVGAAAVAFTRAGDAVGALGLAEGMADARGRALTFVLIAVAQAEAGNEIGATTTLERSLDTVETVAGAGDRDLLMALVAWAQAVADDAVGMGDSLAEIADPEVLAEALAWVSKVQAEAGDTPAALATAQRIPDVAAGEAAVLIVVAEAVAIDGFRAFDLLMQRRDVRPRVRALIQIAAAQTEAGEAAEASRTYELALEAARAIEHGGDRTRALEAVAENRVGTGRLPGFGRAGGTANLSTFNAAVSGDAWATAELLRIALEPDLEDERIDSERAWIVARLAAALADAGDRAEARATAALALEIVQERSRPEDRALPLLFIATAQARAGDIEGALATARRIAEGD